MAITGLASRRLVVALLGLLACAAGPALAQAPPAEWRYESIAQGPVACTPGTSIIGLDHDRDDNPVVAWQQDCTRGSGARPSVFWSRRTGGAWSTNEFISDRRYQGGGDADRAHTLAVMPLDGVPMFVYTSVGPFNETNTYRVDLDAARTSGPVSIYLEHLAAPQTGGTANYSLAAGATSGAASGPQWATGYYLANDFGHVRINGTQISTNAVYRPRVAFALAPDGGQHLLWSTGTQIFYTRRLPGDLLYRTESFLLGLERLGGEARLSADQNGVLHALVRGYDPDYSGDGGTIAYFWSTDRGQTWNGPEYVDPWDAVRSNPGLHSDIALAVDANGVPGVTYWKSRQQLWFAKRDGPGGGWTQSLVATRPNVDQARAAQLDFDRAGRPVVAFWDPPSGRVMLATLAPPNRPPAIAAVLPRWSLFEGDVISLAMTRIVSATDPDGDQLVYTVSGLPAGLVYEPTLGAVTGTVARNSAGDYTVVVQVADPAGEAASATVIFSVIARPALRSVTTLRVSTGLTAPGAPLQLAVTVASESPTDQVPSGTVAVRIEPGGTLLGQLALDGNGSTGLTVAAPAYGTYSLIAAYAGSPAFLPSEAEAPLTVLDGALAPQVRPLPDRVDAPGTFVAIPIEVHSPANRSLTVTLAGAPADAVYQEFEERIIVAQPLTGASRGVHRVVVTVSDGIQEASTSFTWTVEGNAPPVILQSAYPRVFPGDLVSYRFNVVDRDNDPLRVSVEGLPDGLTFDAATLTISGMFLAQQTRGPGPVRINVTDGYWLLAETAGLSFGVLFDVALSSDLSIAPIHAGDREVRGVLTVTPSAASLTPSTWTGHVPLLSYTVQLPSGTRVQGIEPGPYPEHWRHCERSGFEQLSCVQFFDPSDPAPLRLRLGLPISPGPLVHRVEANIIPFTRQSALDPDIRDPQAANNAVLGQATPAVLPATGRTAMVIVVEHNNDQQTSVSWSGLNRGATSAVTTTLADIGVPAAVSDLVQSVSATVYNAASASLAAATRSLVNRIKARVIDENAASAGCYADMLSSLAADPELANKHPIEGFNDRYGEDWVADCLRQMAEPYYDRVETLTDQAATFVNFKAAIERLHDEGYTVDLLLDIHGCGTPSTRNNARCGPDPWLLFSDGPAYRDGVVRVENFREKPVPTLRSINSFFNASLRNADGTPAPAVPGYVRLNAVYMVSCWGSNENQMWLEMGAKASNGAEELNYSIIISPFTFLDQFTRNRATLDEAARRAYEDERVLFEGVPFSFTVDFSMVPGCSQCRYTADLGAVYSRKLAMRLSQEWGADKNQPVSPLESSRRVGVVAVPVSTTDETIYVTDPTSGARLAIVVPIAVESDGTMTLQTSMQGPPLDVHQSLGQPAVQFDLTTTAGLAGPIEVCFPYDPARFTNPATLRLLHYESDAGAWMDRTSSHDLENHVICASVYAFSPFAVVEFANRMPTADAGKDRSVPAAGPGGAAVTLDASTSSDPDGDALTFEWTWKAGSATGPVTTVALPVGTHEVVLTVADSFGGTSTDTLVVTVTLVCDLDGDGKVTASDLALIRSRNNQLATDPGDPYDVNGDGRINIADVRYCQLRLTP